MTQHADGLIFLILFTCINVPYPPSSWLCVTAASLVNSSACVSQKRTLLSPAAVHVTLSLEADGLV